MHAWRQRGALAEAGPLSNTPREERADPTLTLPCEARKHVISRTDYGFIDSQCESCTFVYDVIRTEDVIPITVNLEVS